MLERYAFVAPTERGKTTSLTAYALWGYHKRYPDDPIYSNYYLFDGSGIKDKNHLHPNFKPIYSFRQAGELKERCLLLIDELSKYARSYEGQSRQNKLYTELAANLRKDNVSFSWSDQWPNAVHNTIRNNVERWIEPFYIEENNGHPLYDENDPYGFPIETPYIKFFEYRTSDDYYAKNPVTYWQIDPMQKAYVDIFGTEADQIEIRRPEVSYISELSKIWKYFDTTQKIPYFEEKRMMHKEYFRMKAWLAKQVDISTLNKTRLLELLALYNQTVETTTGWPLSNEEKTALVAMARTKGLFQE